MAELLTYTENRKGHFLFCVGAYDGETHGYLDITTAVKAAQAKDRRNGYRGIGPNAAQEIQKAQDYADYVIEYATMDNLTRFAVERREWFCYTSKLTPQQIHDSNAVKEAAPKNSRSKAA